MANFTLIQPPLAETAVTGFVAAGERTVGGAHWRAEAYAGEPIRLVRDGKLIAWADAGPRGRRLAHDLAEFLNKAAAIKA